MQGARTLGCGLTASALVFKQDEMAGRYVIGLASASGLARELHRIGAEGKPLSYIDEYASLVRAVTLADIKQVATLLDATKLVTAAAGTLKK